MASEALLSLLREAEGFANAPYQCPAGRWTIGYGHTGPDVTAASPSITRDDGERLLLADVDRAEAGVLVRCPTLKGEPQPRIDAMIDFAFNFGPARVHGTTLEKRIADKDWMGAAAQLRRWVYARVQNSEGQWENKRLAGLVKRRDITARWMADGA